jgi:hypothetical protein
MNSAIAAREKEPSNVNAVRLHGLDQLSRCVGRINHEPMSVTAYALSVIACGRGSGRVLCHGAFRPALPSQPEDVQEYPQA